MTQMIVLTGASSGFGALAAHARAESKRSFRVHIDPSQDGAEVVNGVADRVRAELLRRIGLADLLHPIA